MLQQTRVETVIPYYSRFLERFPTVQALAEAPIERVLELWSGLGYYRRARLLHRGAHEVTTQHRGVLPRAPGELRAISGIGRYTAGAIASIAYGVAAPVVDGNVTRVLSRLEALRDDPASVRGRARLWAVATDLAQCDKPGDLNQALMELGATVCTPKAPACATCPVSAFCKARARGIEHTLPRIHRKAPPPTVELHAFVVDAGEAIVCGQRAPDALYGGMWEPPMLERKPRRMFGLGAAAFESRGRITHVLTHRRLDVEVLYARARKPDVGRLRPYVRVELVAKTELGRRAMSRLAQRVLAAALEADRGAHFRSL